MSSRNIRPAERNNCGWHGLLPLFATIVSGLTISCSMISPSRQQPRASLLCISYAGRTLAQTFYNRGGTRIPRYLCSRDYRVLSYRSTALSFSQFPRPTRLPRLLCSRYHRVFTKPIARCVYETEFTRLLARGTTTSRTTRRAFDSSNNFTRPENRPPCYDRLDVRPLGLTARMDESCRLTTINLSLTTIY